MMENLDCIIQEIRPYSIAILFVIVVFSIAFIWSKWGLSLHFKKDPVTKRDVERTAKRTAQEIFRDAHDENKPHTSWLRWASTAVLIITFAIAWYQQITTDHIQEGLIIGLVGLALTGKVAQKAVENRWRQSSHSQIDITKYEPVHRPDDIPEDENIEDDGLPGPG